MTDVRHHRREAFIAGAVVAIMMLAGCGNFSRAPQHLGSFPIAYPQPAALPTTSPGHLILLAMGESARVDLGDGRVVLITATGPSFPTPPPGVAPSSSVGRMRVLVTAEKGTVTVKASDFVGTNQQGQAVRLTATPAVLTLAQGQRGTFQMAGTFTEGEGALSYLPSGHPTVTWDFNVELD